ncbi:MAG: ABC-2 family transporter protein [Deltaproteobacteria bacterium]|nr:ABC-2 family transporter protein [Deltaproteobacteria bacterium]
MTAALRYPRLLALQLRVSLTTAMQYRADFVVEGLMSVYWVSWNLLPLLILYADRPSVAGWDFPSALVVIGWFVVLRGILEGAINPSLVDIVERIRTGAFDYVLLKPADSQFLISTARFAPWRIIDVIGGFVILVIAFARLGRTPAVGDLAAGGLLMLAAVIVMYALWVGVVAASFWVVRLDNLTYLLGALFDTARWPVQVFRGAWRFLFTFVLPMALMTTYPAMALLGRIDVTTALACVAGALALAIGARLLWIGAVRNYTSASS